VKVHPTDADKAKIEDLGKGVCPVCSWRGSDYDTLLERFEELRVD
jgi:hypothetical protein